MAEEKVESVKQAKSTRSKKKALANKLIGVVDTTKEDVLNYIKEGRELYFMDGKDFLELSDDIVAQMSYATKERYGLAKRITNGEDVVGAIQDGIRGWEKDYNVRPGSASDNMAVFGKKPGKEYFWTTKAKLNSSKMRGWEIDHDPDVHTLHNDPGTLKTVGGERQPELILMSRPKEIRAKLRKQRLDRADKLLGQTKEKFVENAAKIGVVATIDE